MVVAFWKLISIPKPVVFGFPGVCVLQHLDVIFDRFCLFTFSEHLVGYQGQMYW